MMILAPDSSVQQHCAALAQPAYSAGFARVVAQFQQQQQLLQAPLAAYPPASAAMPCGPPTMDSTVSSARPEPELNIGTVRTTARGCTHVAARSRGVSARRRRSASE